MEENSMPKPERKGLARRIAPVVVAGSLIAGVVGGGVAGSAATVYWMAGQPTQTASLAPAAASANYQVAAVTSETNISAIYKQASPSIVGVTAVTNGGGTRSRGFSPQQAEATGTGIIVSDQGYVLTNYHIVQGASSLSITLLDGTNLNATVAGSDPGNDLAVLKADIPKEKISVAALGDSSKVQPGDLAVAIGNPFGFDHTVTAGIISGVGREFGTANGRPMSDLIQTDAPINPGNSGGALLNAQGEVIGVTASIDSPVEGSVGVGFAIPINKAKQLLPQLEKGQAVQHTYLGITGGAITPDLSAAHQFPVDSGILVVTVTPNSPADKAGLKGGDTTNSAVPTGGDIITEVDGHAVKTVPDISNYLDTKKVGDTVTLTVIRNGQTMKIKVTLGAWPSSTQG